MTNPQNAQDRALDAAALLAELRENGADDEWIDEHFVGLRETVEG